MVQQRPGDVLEIKFEGGWYYVVVVTKRFMFGGNIVYAFHGDASRQENFVADPGLPGFNICTDLLLPKKTGIVTRIAKVADPEDYLKSPLIKNCNEYRPGYKATRWWISTVTDPRTTIAIVDKLSPEQCLAMDSGMISFDLVVKKILSGYTPDQNPF